MGAKLNTFKPDSEKYEDKLQLKKIFARVRVLDGLQPWCSYVMAIEIGVGVW